MIQTTSHIEWNLRYRGEPMFSPVFESFEQVNHYRANSPDPDEYEIISRIVVTQKTDWTVWK